MFWRCKVAVESCLHPVAWSDRWKTASRTPEFFTPSPLAAHADEYHSLQVEVNQPSLTVDTSKGYYNQPFYNDPPDTRIQRVTVQYCQIKKGGSSQRGFIYNPSKQANHPRLVNGRISNNLKSSRNHAGIEHCFSHAESLFER
jgi:hypothetical protein